MSRKFPVSLRALAGALFLASALAAGPACAADKGVESPVHGVAAEKKGPAEHGAPAEQGVAAEHGGGHDAHGAGQMKDFMWRWIDFAVMAGILVWALKKADLKGALARRRDNIEQLLTDATRAREEAERKLAEYSEKLDRANREVEEISAGIRREGELEKARIIAEAQAGADKIREQARRAGEQEVRKALAELRAEAGRLAVELAEQKIRKNIGKKDQDRLVDEYLSKVVELQ
ncbi:MAG TPA: ATP synthase F0 subunit B [Verrucomicrobiae bacterium]|nr:ATP synthase F0 subunit B [Verrucomicrobiae bacterium]